MIRDASLITDICFFGLVNIESVVAVHIKGLAVVLVDKLLNLEKSKTSWQSKPTLLDIPVYSHQIVE